MAVWQLDDELWFPNPRWGEDDGLVAIGGDLSVERLVLAYSNGFFPWYAFQMEREYQQEAGLKCKVTIDGYTDFVFLNKDGFVYNQSSLNRAIKRTIRDCNDAQFEMSESPEVLLPDFSCHSLRHTFTTRMCEAGTNIKLMQDILGHQDISTTMNIYADVTKELREKELGNLEAIFSKTNSAE